MELDAHYFVVEVGFNLSNVIGQRAIVNVPGQRGGNITMCAAITQNGVLHHHAKLGPYNTDHIIRFLDAVHDMLVQGLQNEDQGDLSSSGIMSAFITPSGPQLVCCSSTFFCIYLPPYSPFLNPIEEFFSSWRWKVYDRRPCVNMTLLEAMDEACGDINASSIQGWIRHTRRFFPQCQERT